MAALVAHASTLVPFVAAVLWPHEILHAQCVSKSFKRIIEAAIDWEGECVRFFDISLPIASFSDASTVLSLPPSFWKREYKLRFRGIKGKCSYCGEAAAFTQGEYQSERGLLFCVSCWEEQVWDEERAHRAISLSLNNARNSGSLDHLMDMEIMLQPAFSLGLQRLYLKSDIAEYLKLMGTETIIEEQDIFTNSWREQVKHALMAAGVDRDKSENLATNVFPPDGTPVSAIVGAILSSDSSLGPASFDAMDIEPSRDSPRESPLVRRRRSSGSPAVQHRPPSPRLSVSERDGRERMLKSMLVTRGISYEHAINSPFGKVIAEFLDGRGFYTHESLVSTLEGSLAKHDSFTSTLDSLERRIRR